MSNNDLPINVIDIKFDQRGVSSVISIDIEKIMLDQNRLARAKEAISEISMIASRIGAGDDDISPAERIEELAESNRNLGARLEKRDAELGETIRLLHDEKAKSNGLNERSRALANLRGSLISTLGIFSGASDDDLVGEVAKLRAVALDYKRLRDELARQQATERDRVIDAVNAGLDESAKRIEAYRIERHDLCAAAAG
jgi:hypothetical protein